MQERLKNTLTHVTRKMLKTKNKEERWKPWEETGTLFWIEGW